MSIPFWARRISVFMILVALLVPTVGSAGAQAAPLCGYFQDDGYFFYSFYPHAGSQAVPTYFSADNFQSVFGFDIHAGRVWVTLMDPDYNRSGVLTNFESFKIVSSCGSGNTINPVVNAVLPLAPSCSSSVTVSIDRTNMASDWQRAVASAAQTWGRAGSQLRVSTSAPSESQRSLAAVDYQGNPITVNNQSLRLAPCEIRVFRSSSLQSKYIVSLEGAWRARTADLAGWVQPFSRDGKYEEAALLVLNDRNIGAGGGMNLTLATNPSPLNLDVETIALHELGHAVGLKHVQDGWAVMSGSSFDHLYQLAGGTRRALEPSDVRALKARFGEASSSSAPRQSGGQQVRQAQVSSEVSYAALRRTPGYSGKDESDVVTSIPAGSVVQIMGPSQSADGLTWWQVSWGGATGWVADHTGSGKTLLLFLN